MPYVPGDHVHVASFGKGTVRDARNGDRYLVDLKGRSMVVHASQLTALHDHTPRRTTPIAGGSGDDASHLGRAHAQASIDLHGMTRVEAISALDAFLNDAMLAGLAEVRVIHGRSGGLVKSAVHARLDTFASVQGFRLDPRNPGVTIVCL